MTDCPTAPLAAESGTASAVYSLGNPGDVKPVGEGVSELRIDAGPGYRVYFVRSGSAVVLLLNGGDKRTQSRDIATARDMARTLKG